MATLEINLDATLIVQMVRALNTFCMERPDLLSEILYEHGETLAEVAGGVDALRALEHAAADRDLTEAEDAALHTARANGGAWMRKKAGQILATLESPLRDDRPGQDAGAALVGVECLLWDGEWEDYMNPNFCRIVTESKGGKYTHAAAPNRLWDHARPTYLGLPA